MTWRAFVGTVLMVGLLTTPTLANAIIMPADQLPPAQLVSQTQAELTALGCTTAPLSDDEVVTVPPGQPFRLFARDQPVDSVMFCSAVAAQQVTIVTGQVAQATTDDSLIDCTSAGSLKQKLGCETIAAAAKAFGVPGTVTKSLLGADTALSRGAAATASATIGVVANAVSAVGRFVLDIALSLLVFALATPTFISNPLVQIGWPFVQGLANLGFMLALLFIAFATTLQLEGFSPTRQLPRLLIAAVLINFSLIISGILIDVTRVIMSILINTLGDVSLDKLPNHLLHNSGINEITAGFKTLGLANFDYAATAILKAIITWSVALGFLTIALTLLVRYIALILLLIVSPIAYLGFALPQTEGYAKQWWTSFFKYLFSGPIALFFIILVIQMNQLGLAQVVNTTGQPAGTKIMQALIVTAMLVIAAVASMKMADKGSAAAVGAFANRAKRTGMWAGRTAVGTATYLPRAAGKAAVATGKDFAKQAGKNLLQSRGWKTDKSAGTQLANKYVSPATRSDRQATTAARAAAPNVVAAGNNPGLWDRTVVNPVNLRQKATTDGLGKNTVIDHVIQHTDDTNDVRAIIENDSFMKSLNGGEQLQLINNIRTNDNIQIVPDLEPAARAAMAPAEIRQFDQRRNEQNAQGREKMVTSALQAIARLNREK